ncbi:Nif3-like dinuclear metal center hexameric protein [Virgibacillus sp. W0181]|uniref:Nif3-like dinuclear metal center hexameric protein n=1 Tax=Virgibacillus sp. W0181 TaxID=3391581 RepID=UPI003F4550A3
MTNELTNDVIFQTMEKETPLNLAFDWDNVGLQVGSYKQTPKRVMVTLDVTEAVVDEAIDKEIDLIIAHHPLLFQSIKQININSVKGRVIQKLISQNISVYAAHTNLDIAENGVNDILCNLLGIDITDNLVDLEHEKLFKLVVYIPKSHAEKVRNNMSLAGAGHIGNYSHCTFQTEGQGTFKPQQGTNPYIGTKDELEFVNEIKIETIVKSSDLTKVIDSMITAHPYEEPAYDIFPLQNKGKALGLGRIGNLANSVPLGVFAEQVKKAFQQSHVRLIGKQDKKVKKVAVLGGSGEKFIQQAKQKDADVYVTGDMSFHQAQDALEMGLAVIDAGHYIESAMKEALQQFLKKKFGQSLDIYISETNTDPFKYV